ncbi:MAG TPA: hypothetical protein VKR78_01050 [Acidimicrobiales bacterium]|nr:hypothetical protein [Acidimicrobiales bacterium]
MNLLLPLGLALGGFAIYELVKSPSSGTGTLTAAQQQQNAGLIAANQALAGLPTTAPAGAAYNASDPSTYGYPGTPSTAVPPDWGPSGVAPGTPAAAASTSGPLYHTGAACCGAPLVVDGEGNPYLMGLPGY